MIVSSNVKSSIVVWGAKRIQLLLKDVDFYSMKSIFSVFLIH